MKVLSLFDGISVCQHALRSLSFPIEEYTASEIELNAIKTTQRNYPTTIQAGSVVDLDFTKYKNLDLLTAGSPCQNFSAISSRKGMIDSKGNKITALAQYLALKSSGEAFEGESYLFWEFVRGLHETQPKYFMLENVEMPDEWYDLLCKVLGDYYATSPNFDPELPNYSNVNGNNLLIPFEINASKFSAQSRKRLYWTNIPVDSNALAVATCDDTLATIMQPNIPEKYFYKQTFEHRTESRNHAILDINGHDILKRVYYPDQKCPTLTRVSGGNQQKKVIDGAHARKLTPQEYELAQGLPLDYTKGISDTARYCALGNSWCSPVIQFIFSHIPTKL